MASACGFVLLWLCGFVAGGYTKVTLCAGLARENGVALSSEQLQAILESLPLYAWLTVQTTSLSAHPSDPGNS